MVGHRVSASAIVADRLAGEADLGAVLARMDEVGGRLPGAAAATLCVAVLDQASGAIDYAICGHPAPLVVTAESGHRFLPATGAGPLGTGTWARPGTATLDPGDVLVLYSDGLVERPHRTWTDGLAELARVTEDAAANRALRLNAPTSAAERITQQCVELLTRTGYADDVPIPGGGTPPRTAARAEPDPAGHARRDPRCDASASSGGRGSSPRSRRSSTAEDRRFGALPVRSDRVTRPVDDHGRAPPTGCE